MQREERLNANKKQRIGYVAKEKKINAIVEKEASPHQSEAQQKINNWTMALLSAAIRRAMAPRATAALRSMSTKTRADLLAGSGWVLWCDLVKERDDCSSAMCVENILSTYMSINILMVIDVF